MSNGAHNEMQRVHQAIQINSTCVRSFEDSPAGLLPPVPAHRIRSCSTRSYTMNLARSTALHAAQKPTIPATHEISVPNKW
jgi:hypothetical protein